MIGFGDFKYRTNFVRPLVLAIAVSFILAGGHVFFGTELQQTLSAQELLTLDDYVFALSTAVGFLIPAGYFLRTRDVSESLAISLALVWSLLISGLQDVFVYLLHPDALPESLPWLNDGFVGAWARVIGLDSVTDFALISWILVSGVVTVLLIEFLYEFEDYGL